MEHNGPGNDAKIFRASILIITTVVILWLGGLAWLAYWAVNR